MLNLSYLVGQELENYDEVFIKNIMNTVQDI